MCLRRNVLEECTAPFRNAEPASCSGTFAPLIHTNRFEGERWLEGRESMPGSEGDTGASSLDKFDWGLHPDLERFVSSNVSSFLAHQGFARTMSEKMMSQTSTRFVDWVDHIVLPESETESGTLERLGLEQVYTSGDMEDTRVYRHLGSYLFPIL